MGAGARSRQNILASRRRWTAKRGRGAREDGRKGPVPWPGDPEPRRSFFALDHRKELTMMDRTATVVERNYQEPREDEQPPRFPRKSVDPDAALVAQLRRADTGAAEALVGAYGDRVYRLAIRITGNASDAEEVVQD